MDLHNNKVGEIGAENPEKSHFEIAQLVAQALHEGRLITDVKMVPISR